MRSGDDTKRLVGQKLNVFEEAAARDIQKIAEQVEAKHGQNTESLLTQFDKLVSDYSQRADAAKSPIESGYSEDAVAKALKTEGQVSVTAAYGQTNETSDDMFGAIAGVVNHKTVKLPGE